MILNYYMNKIKMGTTKLSTPSYQLLPFTYKLNVHLMYK